MVNGIINIGKVNISSLVNKLFIEEDINNAIYRISHKDFGELCDEEVQIQLMDIQCEDKKSMKLFGIYKSYNNYEFYVIVSENRENTKILLCSEYDN